MKRMKLTSFILTVFMLLTVLPLSVSAATEAEAQADLDALSIPSVLFAGYELPTGGTVNGTTIEWESDPIGAFAADNKTIVAGSVDTPVTLTAYAIYGDGENDYVTKDFTVTIKRSSVVFYDGFDDAEAGTNISDRSGWKRHAPSKTGTNFTIEKESETSDNMVFKIERTTADTNYTNYVMGINNYELTYLKDFKLSFDLCSADDTNYIELMGVGTWTELSTGKLRPDKDLCMFNLFLDYTNNIIYYKCVNPVAEGENQMTVIGSKRLKVGVPQTFEFQADYEEQAFWLLVDGQRVSTQPIPYTRQNNYGLKKSDGTLFGNHGYADRKEDVALQEIWFGRSARNAQDVSTQAIFTVDNVELALESSDYSFERTIDVEYWRTAQNNLTFDPKIADGLWRIVAGAETAGKTAIVAVYNSAYQLIDLLPVTINEEGYANFNYIFNGAKYIKAFLWDSIDTLKPLSESYTEEVR